MPFDASSEPVSVVSVHSELAYPDSSRHEKLSDGNPLVVAPFTTPPANAEEAAAAAFVTSGSTSSNLLYKCSKVKYCSSAKEIIYHEALSRIKHCN